ncbi:hypothetical protein ACFVYE_45210 [Streptomyces sp. NPDC058239]|uniref:hypothetical protein n=1 Tax=Streptomyces sp. NPDC058239 TaxID=3346395 RepID=UPI0036E7664E
MRSRRLGSVDVRAETQHAYNAELQNRMAPRPRAVVPAGTQLLGLALLLTMIVVLVHTCRLTTADGLGMITPVGQGERAARRLHQQSGAERQLRWLLVLYPTVLAILLPVPDTWVRFWFWSTVLLSLSAMLSLGSLLQGAGHADCRQGVPDAQDFWNPHAVSR